MAEVQYDLELAALSWAQLAASEAGARSAVLTAWETGRDAGGDIKLLAAIINERERRDAEADRG